MPYQPELLAQPAETPSFGNPFCREAIAIRLAMAKRIGMHQGDYLPIPSSMARRLKQIVRILEDPWINQFIEAGKLTFAIIKPHAEQNKKGLTDGEATEAIIASIHPPPIVTLSTVWTNDFIEDFYQGDSKKRMREAPAQQEGFANKWEEFAHLMTDGPVTAMLLYSPQGDAVSKWRNHIGPNYIPEENLPGTIRRDFARSVYNNLVHGSDSIESVKRELSLFRNFLTNWSILGLKNFRER